MTWADLRKRFYLPILAIALLTAIATLYALPPAYRLHGAAVLAVVFLLPGMLGRWLLKDLLASRACFARGDFNRALDSARRFLKAVEARPWIRHAIWAQYGTYTLDVRAMALNNTGAALMELKRFAEARDMLRAANDADSAYPIPVYNLAVIAKLEGNEAASERLAREAAQLGFARGNLDQTLLAIGDAYSRLVTPR